MWNSSVPVTELPLVLRVYPGTRRRKQSVTGGVKWPSSVLVFDTETTTGPDQRLLFGAYMWGEWDEAGRVIPSEEGVFHADDLDGFDREGFAELMKYAHARDVRILSRREFVDQVFWKVGYMAESLIVGFNLPFDLSSLAVGCGKARGRQRGGFSLVVWDYWDKKESLFRPNSHRPRVVINHVDSTRSFIRFKSGKDISREDYNHGRFLDLRTFFHALTGEKSSLRSACEAMNVSNPKGTVEQHGVITSEYIDYCRQDVAATAGLLEALRREFDSYPIDLHPDRAYSPASIAKAFIRAMGITPPIQRFDGVR